MKINYEKSRGNRAFHKVNSRLPYFKLFSLTIFLTY